MRRVKIYAGIILLMVLTKPGLTQQLRLGNNPYTVEKSAVLELVSNNQGLLLPRITDTSLINTLNPPDGMMIFFTPAKKLFLRTNGSWIGLTTVDSVVTSVNGNRGALTMDTTYISNFYSKVRSLFSATTPITFSNGQIGISQATTSTNGYLSSTDWTTFNNKVSSQWTTSGSNIYYNTGNVGIGSSTFNGTFPEKLLVDAGTTTSVNAIVAKGTINSYLQLNIQNLSSGTSASSDVVATADNGSETTNYVNMGINGSGNTSNVMGGANDAYFYNLGQNLLIGTGTTAKSLVFMTGGQTQSTNERMRIDGSGNVGIGVTGPTALLHLKAGTATASTAPLKFTAGTNLTTPENGALEYNGTNLFITNAGVRQTILTAGTLNNNRIMVSSGGSITEAAALTNGQLLIGSTGNAPTAATLTAGNGISVTNGSGSITITNTNPAYRTLVTTSSDFILNFKDTLSNIPGLSFTATAGVFYRFEVLLAVNNTGATGDYFDFAINGPALTYMGALISMAKSATTFEFGSVNAYNATTTAADALVGINIVKFDGMIKTSSTGTVVFRIRPKNSNKGVLLAGATLEYW